MDDNNKKKIWVVVGDIYLVQTAMAMFVCALVGDKKIPDFPL